MGESAVLRDLQENRPRSRPPLHVVRHRLPFPSEMRWMRSWIDAMLFLFGVGCRHVSGKPIMRSSSQSHAQVCRTCVKSEHVHRRMCF